MATGEENQRPAKRVQKEIGRTCARVRADLEGEPVRVRTCACECAGRLCVAFYATGHREMGL